jgi:hypothetical protein
MYPILCSSNSINLLLLYISKNVLDFHLYVVIIKIFLCSNYKNVFAASSGDVHKVNKLYEIEADLHIFILFVKFI